MARRRKIKTWKTRRIVNIKVQKSGQREDYLLTFKDVEDLISIFNNENDKIIDR